MHAYKLRRIFPRLKKRKEKKQRKTERKKKGQPMCVHVPAYFYLDYGRDNTSTQICMFTDTCTSSYMYGNIHYHNYGSTSYHM